MTRITTAHPAHRLALVCLAAAVATLVGCGDSGADAPIAAKPTPFDVAAAKARAVTAATESAASPEQAAPATEAEADEPKVAYQPPFPEREEMFQPPRQAPRNLRSRDGDIASDVVLMGFADLGEPKVVLAINGVVTPMSGGDELAGVRVISIAPPRAVLQRGRSRWTASIE